MLENRLQEACREKAHLAVSYAPAFHPFPSRIANEKPDVAAPSLMNSDPAAQDLLSPSLQRRIDLLELQKEADDLARTAETIPWDMASVRRGTLPKDFIQKLKQTEKLSKQLRSQISQ